MGLFSAKPRPVVAAVSVGSSSGAPGTIGARAASPNTAGLTAQAWQHEIWGFNDTEGPLKFAGTYRGNMYRRVHLKIGVRPLDDPDGVPIPADEILDPEKPDVHVDHVPEDLIRQAQIELSRIRSPFGQQHILADIGVNLMIAGECRLAVEPDPSEVNGEVWNIYSVVELRNAGTWPDGSPRWTEVGPPSRELPPGTTVWRLFQPHPARHRMADSSAMGALASLKELAWCARSWQSLLQSRVAGSGILTVPQELGLMQPADPTNPNGPSKFAADLTRHMSTPLRDDAAASNLVPHFVEGPAEYLKPEYFHHIKFERPADPVIAAREKDALMKLAMSLDTPPEILTGVGDVSHWNAAQVSVDAWEAHGEPGMIVICALLTAMPLRALLTAASRANGGERWTPQQIANVLVLHDPSDVISHPNRGQDAKDLYAVGAIGPGALRKATNFEDEDAPSDEEYAQWLAARSARRDTGTSVSDTPSNTNVAPQAVPTVNAPVVETVRPPVAVRAATPPPRVLTAARATTRPVGQRLTDLDQALFHRVHAAAQAAVRRNLERAGNRIATKAKNNPAMRAVTAATPRHRIPAVLGKPVVASLGLTDADLLGDFEDLLDDVDTGVERTRKQGLAAIVAYAAAHGRTLTDAQIIEYETAARNHAQVGRQALAAALGGFVANELYSVNGVGDIRGEGVEAGDIPPGLIRSALAEYGGQVGSVSEDNPLRGVASGADTLGVAAALGMQTAEWVWIHSGSSRPFVPHLDLDGVVVEGPGDTRLNNDTEQWTGYGSLFPGDHPGCGCLIEASISYADASSGTSDGSVVVV